VWKEREKFKKFESFFDSMWVRKEKERAIIILRLKRETERVIQIECQKFQMFTCISIIFNLLSIHSHIDHWPRKKEEENFIQKAILKNLKK
jgi:hypothetical protein